MSPLPRIHFLEYFPCFLCRGAIPNTPLFRWFHPQNNPGKDLPVVHVPYLLVSSHRYRMWIANPWFRTIDKTPIFMCFQQHSPIQRPCPIISARVTVLARNLVTVSDSLAMFAFSCLLPDPYVQFLCP